MTVKERYLEESMNTILMINPSLAKRKDELENIISRTIKTKVQDPTITLDNNVNGDHVDITLIRLCGWIENSNPVVSGNATFYMQPTQLLSPTSNMLRTLKKERKAVKNKMFSFKPGSDEYAMLDLTQQNIKVIMNAEYGGSGAPTAAFYTKYSPAATTLMAQSIITTMAAFFESYLGDNQKFFSINECFDWLNHVIRKDEIIPNWIVVPSPKDVADRIKTHFYQLDIRVIPLIEGFVSNCNQTQLVYLYYANNMKDFIRNHPPVQELICKVLTSLPNYEAAEKELPVQFNSQFANESDPIAKYNKWMSKQMFLDPYDIPKTIEEPMQEFIRLMTQFIYVEYLTPDSIVKLNNHYRNTVLLVDTDSNIINADIFVSFILDEIFKNKSFGRKRLYNEMILVNVIASALSKSVALMLDNYGRKHHMDKESRAEFTMKNEFMFRILFLMKTKKRYAASIVLREGNIIIPFKPEIKGVDFIKAGVTDDVEKRFKNMLCSHILFSEDLELHELMDDIKKFEKEIYEDLCKGGLTYLKSAVYKSEDGYGKVRDKDGNVTGSVAWRLPVFKGSAIWNELYPDRRISSLDRVHILKLTVTNQNDLLKIADKYPKEYQMVMNKIYNSKNEYIRNLGLKIICIPNTVYQIPEWMIPLIDTNTIISDTISSFKSVLEALNLEDVSFKTPNGTANITSCLISI